MRYIAIMVVLTACGSAEVPGTVAVSVAAPPDVGFVSDGGAVDDADPGDDVPDGEADSDQDGIPDQVEVDEGTDPNNPDSDGDGYWDGWERAAGTDPNDPQSHPEYELPPGRPYLVVPTRVVEPALLGPLVNSRLGSIPPILIFIDGLSDGQDDDVSALGGVGQLISPGPDDVAGNHDDEYGMRYSSISQQTGAYLVSLDGSVVELGLEVSGDVLRLDLSGVSELTEGVTLRVQEASLTATFDEGLLTLSSGELRGVLTREGVAELVEKFQEFFPIDPDIITEQLDSDGDGRIDVEMTFAGRSVTVPGFTAPPRVAEPAGRPHGECCPDGAEEGDSIAPYLIDAWGDQGIAPGEEDLARRAIDALLMDPQLQMVATARVIGDHVQYAVYGTAGWVEFARDGDEFVVVRAEGDNPLANRDPTALGTYDAFLEAGENPEGTVYEVGYEPDDPRVRFISRGAMHFPYAYERIAAYFADPRAGDLAIVSASYATGGFSSHGHLGALQSRSPLVWAGPGVRRAEDGAESGDEIVDLAGQGSALFHNAAVRGVDIAPTIAAALGVQRHALGVRRGYFRADTLLANEDGRVLREVFTSDALARIDGGEAVAERAIIVINDGLTALEINHEVTTDGFEVPAYRALAARGLTFRYGSITNWPSNTYPSHNMVGSGSYSGHHGILDNTIYERETTTTFSLISALFGTEKFFGSARAQLPVETIFEAVKRTFPNAFTVSINDPSSRGADFSTLERRKPDDLVIPDPAGEIVVGGVVYGLPEVDTSDFEGLVDNSTLFSLAGVYLGEGTEPPRMTIVNFSSTDGAGHAGGPHGALLRETVLPRMNARMEILFAILEQAGLTQTTLVVLTSDHGMELKDRSRRGSPTTTLSEADVKFIQVGDGIYFRKMAVSVERDGGALTVTVVDEDTVDSGAPIPVSGAHVRVVAGAAPAEDFTGSDGVATLTVVNAMGDLELEVLHEDFNPAVYLP
jgi:hypothetical protein